MLGENLRSSIDQAHYDVHPRAITTRAVAYDASIVVALIVATSAIAFIWSHRFLPLQDFPDWLTQGKLFADVLRGHLANEYAFKGVPIPNAISSVCIGVLSLWMRPEIAGKWLLTGYVVGFAAAVSYLLRGRGGRSDPLVLAVSLIFLLNFSFFHGEINYALALVFLYVGFGWVLRHGVSLSVSSALAIALLSLVIFFCHGAGYAAWLIFLAAYAHAVQSMRSRVRVSLAVAPSLAAALIYTASSRLSRLPPISHAAWRDWLFGVGVKLWLSIKFLSPFPGLYPFLDARGAWLLVVGNALFIALVVAILARGSRVDIEYSRFEERLIRSALALFALAFVLAPSRLGGLVNPAERLILPALQLSLLNIAAPARSNVARSRIGWSILALQAIYLHLYAGEASTQLARSYARLSDYASTSTLTIVDESHFDFQSQAHRARPLAWMFLPLHDPLQRITYFASLEAGRPVPIFETGLFRSSLRYAQDDVDSLRQLSRRDPIVILGWMPSSVAIEHLIRGATRLETDDRSFIVLQPHEAVIALTVD